MITLQQLRQFAGEIYPGLPPTLVRLLVAWAQRDPQNSLSPLLDGTGLSSAQFGVALAPLAGQPAEEDKDLLNRCILEAPEGGPLGWHLLSALCDHPGHRVTQALVRSGLNLKTFRNTLLQHKPEPAPTFLGAHGKQLDLEASPLLCYGRDLTALAREGLFDELCDRPDEVACLIEVLLKKQKGNAVLTGLAGVGKTAIVELLSHYIACGQPPESLKGVRLFEISMGKVVAGTIYRGQFEERMESILKALQAASPAILFIDEMHLIWGTGRAEGAPMDVANLLKPMLGRGGIRVIGATTVEEYHQYIARDAALARRFEEIRIEEPNPVLLESMVKKQAHGLASHHGLEIPEDMCRLAIELTNRHLANRSQPDKSVDLLDTSAVRAVRAGSRFLRSDDLLATLAHQTGRPITSLSGEDRAHMSQLASRLKQRIIGQDQAVEKVVATLVFRRQDLGSQERNLGTFLFAGASGVGKTELGRALAAEFYGTDKALLHLDLAEYSGVGAVHQLIGAPPGFAGSEKEGPLTGWLHKRSSGVLLFDEIEKAHPEIHRLLLGLLDNGRLHSGRGERFDTRQCVIILTTNALTPQALRQIPLGFSKTLQRSDETSLLAEHFPREFLARLDDIILFNPLGQTELRAILKLRLNEALTRLESKGLSLIFDENRLLGALLVQLGEAKAGAREIARLLETRLLQPMSLALLRAPEGRSCEFILRDDYYTQGTIQMREAASATLRDDSPK